MNMVGKQVSFMSGGKRISFFSNPKPNNIVRKSVVRRNSIVPLTKKQITRFRKIRRQLDEREKQLSKKHGVKVEILDLNPHFTRGNRIPKGAITRGGRPILTVGLANTRTKTISIDERVPRIGQDNVIKHEIEHIRNPRATEEEVEKITQRKFGFTKLPNRFRRKTFKRLRS